MHAHREILISLARNMNSFGISESEVFEHAKFKLEEVGDEKDMVAGHYGLTLWKSILALSNYPLTGLSFGKNLQFSALTWISGLTQSSKNLRQAWASFCDFSLLMGNMYSYELQDKGDIVEIIYKPHTDWILKDPNSAAQATDHAMSLTMSLSAFLCGRTIQSEYAEVQHSIEKKYIKEYELVFRTIKPNSDLNKIVFNKSVADMPVLSSNEMLYSHMLKFCEEKLKEIKETEKYVDKVKSVLNKKNSFYLPKLEETAAMLHLSARTLQRKLKEEHTQYQTLVEAHQIEQAKNLLRQKEIQIKEVAYLLGYANSESFNRLFKRNTGQSPNEFRFETIKP